MDDDGDREFRDEFLRLDHCVVRLRNGSVYFLEAEEFDDLRRQKKYGNEPYETVDIFGSPAVIDPDMIAEVSRQTNETLQRRAKFRERIEEIMGEKAPWES